MYCAGGDQGILNDFFGSVWGSNIKYKLSFTYNLNANASYFYRPAYNRYKDQIRILHFIGPGKPWLWARDQQGRVLDRAEATFRTEHVQLWWDVHDRNVQLVCMCMSVCVCLTMCRSVRLLTRPPGMQQAACLYHPIAPDAVFRTEWTGGEAHHTGEARNPATPRGTSAPLSSASTS